MYEYDDGEGGGRSPLRLISIIALVGAVLAAGWFVVRPRLSGDDGDENAQAPPVAAATTAVSTTEPSGDDGTASSTDSTDSTDSSDSTDSADSAESTTTTVDSTTSAPSAEASTTSAPPETATPSTAASTTTAPPAETTTTTAPSADSTVPSTFAALPDGSPVPVVAIFDVGRVTLNGAVPDQEAVERLGALALANSRDPAATTVVNNLTINPAVPRNVGVRVIEVTSTRFPEGSAEVLPEHAAELDRVYTVLNALPNVSVLVVGHADQQGNDLANFVLSEDRARAVVVYFAAKGIVPSRLSSRAVGEADLLSIGDDAASLALNRRTEFIFYGLLEE